MRISKEPQGCLVAGNSEPNGPGSRPSAEPLTNRLLKHGMASTDSDKRSRAHTVFDVR
jgi:hypothetical protein